MDGKTNSSGIGLGTLLLVLFIGLKLCKVITWSWWWVLAPAWIGVALFLVILGVLVISAVASGE